jgi:hypothetical protein
MTGKNGLAKPFIIPLTPTILVILDGLLEPGVGPVPVLDRKWQDTLVDVSQDQEAAKQKNVGNARNHSQARREHQACDTQAVAKSRSATDDTDPAGNA